jgi:predicted negative regulator of RcsB-dependent stress response
MAGDGAYAERLSEKFRARNAKLGRLETSWTPEWDNLRGGALLAIGRRDEARDYFERALERKPGLESARKNLEKLR